MGLFPIHNKKSNNKYTDLLNETIKYDIIDANGNHKKSVYNADDLKDHSGVSGIFLNEKNQLLIEYHNKLKMLSVPVGKTDEGDTIEYTLKKEMREETGVEVTDYEELFQFTQGYEREGKIVYVENHTFLIKEYKGTIRNNEPKKHKWIKWMDIDDLIKMIPEKNGRKQLTDATIEFLKWYKNNYILY